MLKCGIELRNMILLVMVNIVIYNWKKGKKRKIRKKFLFMIKIDDLWYKKCFLEIMVDVESRC